MAYMGELMVLSRVVSLVGGYFESVCGVSVSPFVLVIIGFSGLAYIKLHVRPGTDSRIHTVMSDLLS